MTSREIVLANLNHENPPRPGLTFSGGRANDMLSVDVSPAGYEQKRWVEGNQEFYDDVWGNIWSRMVGGCEKGEIHEPVLTSWDKLESMPVPDYADPSCYETMRRRFAEPTEKFRLAHIGGWIFDNARYLRKMEIYLLDLAMYPEELKRLHSIVAGVYEAKIHGAGKAGADGIMIGEDMGTQNGLLFSPDMFREFFKEEYARLFAIAHDYGMKILMHSCGMNWEILEDLLEAGVDCFQFDQPAVYDMPALAELLRRYKAGLWSPTDIQKILPTGDRALIESETQRMLDTFKGCFIGKDYPDLPGIGVEPEWDQWAYEVMARSEWSA